MNPFAFLELEMDAARIARLKKAAEERAKVDAAAAAVEMRRKVEQLTATVALQQEWLENLTEVVTALRAKALDARPGRRGAVSARARSCTLDAALEDGSYE
jgi:hypothetical protein